ncbi:DUF1223 domain-containing protein [Henriciella aquimarina]|uniref:DUF1223 domain-containing protein n=1 Tax=Henriciella aquimarina TaxID=545261 RepID=UPI000A064246|nr:DUF1223 domain-containing protein [Henriciella aquimarina]
MRYILVFLASLAATGLQAVAEPPVLIELFASQNCNACPKAHKTLKAVEAEHESEVLVLTWSVDYWDYLGAPDPMAIPAATERQAAYADRFGIRAPYTPQSVYDGAMQCPATRKKAVESNIKHRVAAKPEGQVKIVPGDATHFSLDGYTPAPAEVHLVEYLAGADNVTDMVNPVTRTRKLGTWTGGRVSFAYECRQSCAVVVQGRGHGEVYAAELLP